MSYIVARFKSGSPWCKYEISIRDSYREDGKVKKKETYLMTYYLIGVSKNSSHPRLDIEYKEQYENISPTHKRYFIDNPNLMNDIVEKVKNAEMRRQKAIDERRNTIDFWSGQIRTIVNEYYSDENSQKQFFYYVNRCGLSRYFTYTRNYFYEHENDIRNKIKEYYMFYQESGE